MLAINELCSHSQPVALSMLTGHSLVSTQPDYARSYFWLLWQANDYCSAETDTMTTGSNQDRVSTPGDRGKLS